MLEITKNMKYSYVNNKGFISVYFLVIFLYVITLVTVISVNLDNQAKTLENFEIHLEEKYQIKDRYIYIQLMNEILIVEYDADKKIVLDYEVNR